MQKIMKIIMDVLISVEAIQTNPQLFTDGLNISNMSISHLRRLSDISIHSTMSGMVENVPLQIVSNCKLNANACIS